MNDVNSDIPVFVYKPEYREEMRKILEKRKKRRVFFWLFFGGVMLAAASTFYVVTNNKEQHNQIADSNIIENKIPESTSSTQEEVVLGSNSKKQDIVVQDSSVKKVPLVSASSTQKTEIPNAQKIKNKENKANHISSDFPLSTPLLSSSSKTRNNREEVKTNEESEIQKENKKVESEQNKSNQSQEAKKNETPVVTIAAPEYTDAIKDTLPKVAEEKVLKKDSGVVAAQSTPNSPSPDTLPAKKEEEEKKKKAKNYFLDDVNVYAGGLIHNTFGNGVYSNGTAFSYRAGIGVAKKINDHSLLSAGLEGTYYNRLYNFGGNDSSILTNDGQTMVGYDYVEKRRTYFYENNYSISLAMPISYIYQLDKLNVYGGLNFEYFIQNSNRVKNDTTVYGVNTFIVNTYVYQYKMSGESTVKNDFSGVSRFQMAAFVGADYRFSNRFSSGVRLSTGLIDLLSNKWISSSGYNSLWNANLYLKFHLL